MDTLAAGTVKTRKDHRCWGCRELIAKGGRAFRVSTADAGTVNTVYWCRACKRVLDEHGREIDPWDEGFMYGEIADDFPETLAEARAATQSLTQEADHE